MNAANTYQLTGEKLKDLVSFITEDHGAEMDEECFTEILLDMLSDIPGLECLDDSQQAEITAIAFDIYKSN